MFKHILVESIHVCLHAARAAQKTALACRRRSVAERLIRKLENYTPLSAEDRTALSFAVTARVRICGAHEDLVHEGDRPDEILVLLDGFAYQYKGLEDGRRQITACLVPGDTTDPRLSLLREIDHSLTTATPARIGSLSRDALLDLVRHHPRVHYGLIRASLADEAISREWVVGLGQRTAPERASHLLCELFHRQEAVGLADGGACTCPLTQVELADALGLSIVHVNRTLQDLRRRGLIELRGRTLTIQRLGALQQVALFNPRYLHLGREERPGEDGRAQDSRAGLPLLPASPSRPPAR